MALKNTNLYEAIQVALTDGAAGLALVAKATQGAVAVPTQDLHNSGRQSVAITIDGFAIAGTPEVLNTLSWSIAGAAVATGSSYVVTAGKRLRLQALSAVLRSTAGNTTPADVIARLRMNAGGAAVLASPLQHVIDLMGLAGANDASRPTVVTFPDGFEIPAGAGIGITTTCPGWVVTTASPIVSLSLLGFEY